MELQFNVIGNKVYFGDKRELDLFRFLNRYTKDKLYSGESILNIDKSQIASDIVKGIIDAYQYDKQSSTTIPNFKLIGDTLTFDFTDNKTPDEISQTVYNRIKMFTNLVNNELSMYENKKSYRFDL